MHKKSSPAGPRRGGRLLSTCVAVALGVSTLAGTASEASAGWVCSAIATNVSHRISAVSYHGLPHVFYQTSSIEAPYEINPYGPGILWTLHNRFKTSVASPLWFTATVAGDLWPSSPTTGTGNLPGRPSVYANTLYLPFTTSSMQLMVAHKSGTSGAWSVTSLDGSGQGTDKGIGRDSSSITFGGKLYIFYTAGDGLGPEELRAAVYDGATWTYQLLDGYGGAGGRIQGKLRAPAAVVHDGKLRVYYVDATNGNIREAVTSNGTSWSFSVLDGDGGPNGRTTDRVREDISPVVYGPAFQPKLRVFYKNHDEGRLRVAELEGGQFHFHDIDGYDGIASGAVDGHVSPWSSAVSYAETRFGAQTPYVFYVHGTQNTLRVASKAGSSWSAMTLDGAGSRSACAGATSTPILGPVTAIVDSEGIRVFYTAWDHTLRHALFTP